jgi:hypothetical protein
MAKQNVRKVTSKTTTQPAAAKLTPQEQRQINLDWEKSTGTPAGRRTEDINVTQDYYNAWGGKGSSLSTNESRGGWTKSGLGAGVSKEVGTLPIKKLQTNTGGQDKIKKSTYSVPVEIKRPSSVGGRLKITGKKAGASFNKRATKNVGTTVLAGKVRGAVQNAKFNREEKLAGAYERRKAGLSQMSSKEKAADLKGQRKYLRSSEMKNTVGMDRKTLSGAKKDLRQAEKYVKKEAKGKVKYFTQEALNKKQELTAAEMKKRKATNQAGKTRYSS